MACSSTSEQISNVHIVLVLAPQVALRIMKRRSVLLETLIFFFESCAEGIEVSFQTLNQIMLARKLAI